MNKETKPAGFLLRLLAFLLEFAIFFFIHSFFWIYLVSSNGLSEFMARAIIYLVVLVISPLGLIYNLGLTYYFGGTLGKLLTGVKVANSEGEKLKFRQVLFRQTIAYQISNLLFGLGYLSIIKDDQKRAWHDKASSTNVFKVRNLWPISILLIVVITGFSIMNLGNIGSVFKNGTLRFELASLYRLKRLEDIQKGQKTDQPTIATDSGKLKISTSSGKIKSPSPTPKIIKAK